MKAHGRREVMSGGGPLGLLAQEPSDQPFAFLLLSLLSPHVTPSVRMTEIPQGSLFCFRQASFSTTKRLHQTKWLLSERIWTNLKSPHALAPVSATFICLICFAFTSNLNVYIKASSVDTLSVSRLTALTSGRK